MSKKWVYLFSEGNASMCELLVGKGAGVAEMTRTAVPVPLGFTLTTDAFNSDSDDGRQFPDGMLASALTDWRDVEANSGKKSGDPLSPVLVSVRSGAREWRPGMMDTVLNLGL